MSESQVYVLDAIAGLYTGPNTPAVKQRDYSTANAHITIVADGVSHFFYFWFDVLSDESVLAFAQYICRQIGDGVFSAEELAPHVRKALEGCDE